MAVDKAYREALGAITQRIVDAQNDPLATLQAVDDGIVTALQRIQQRGQPDDNDVYMLVMFMASAMRVLIARETSITRRIFGG